MCNFNRIWYNNVQGCNSCGGCHQQWHNGCKCCMGMRNFYGNRNLNSFIPNQQGSNVVSSQFGAPHNCYQVPFTVNRGLDNEFVSRIRSYNFTRINLNTQDDKKMAAPPSGIFENQCLCAQGSVPTIGTRIMPVEGRICESQVCILLNQSPKLLNVEESITIPFITERPMQSSSIEPISTSQENFNNEDRISLKSGTESTKSAKKQAIPKNNRMVGYGCKNSESEMSNSPSNVSQSTYTVGSMPTIETRVIPAGDGIREPHAIMHSIDTRSEDSALFNSSPKILTIEESVAIPSTTVTPMQSSAEGSSVAEITESLDTSKPSSQSVGTEAFIAISTISTRGKEEDSEIVEPSLKPIKNENRKISSGTKICVQSNTKNSISTNTQGSQKKDNVFGYGSMNCEQLPDNQSSCTQSVQTVGTNEITQSVLEESIGMSSITETKKSSDVGSMSTECQDKEISTTSTVNKVVQTSSKHIQNEGRKTLSSDKKRYNPSYTKRYKSTQTEDTQRNERMVGFGWKSSENLPESESVASDDKAVSSRNTAADKPCPKFNTSKDNKTNVMCTCKRKIPFTGCPYTEKLNNKATCRINTSKYHNKVGQYETKPCGRCIKTNLCMKNGLEKICFCKPFIGDEITLDSMLMRQSTEGVEASNTQPLKSKNIIDTSIVNKTKDSKRPKPSKQPAKKLEKVKGKSKQKKKLKLMSSSDELVVAKPNTQKNNDIWFRCNVPLRLSIPNEITLEHLLQTTNCQSLANNNNGNTCPKAEMQRITIHPMCIRNAEDPSLATGPSANIAPPLPQSLCSNSQPMEKYPFSPYFQNSALPFFPNSMPGTFQNLGPTSFQGNLPPTLPTSSSPFPASSTNVFSYPNTFSYQPFPYKPKKPALCAERKHKQNKKKEHFRKRTCRQWLSEMFCFKKVWESCLHEKLSAPCRLCYCNCKIRSKEVQTPICRCKECTLHLRKNEIQKQNTPRIKTKLKRNGVESMSTQKVDKFREKNCTQQRKLKSTKTKSSLDESLVVSVKSKTLSDNSKKTMEDKPLRTVNYNKTYDQISKSISIKSGKDESKVSKLLRTLSNTNPSSDRVGKQFRSVGGDIQFKRFSRNNTFDFQNNNFTAKTKNKKLDCRRLNQKTMEFSKTSNVKECDVKLTEPDIYKNCTCLPKSSSSKSVSSALNIFLVKQESNNSPAYLEEYTITACGRFPIQNEDCDMRRLSSGLEITECSNEKNVRNVLRDLKCFFQQKSARNENEKDRLIVMRKPDEWRELNGSQQILKMNNCSFTKFEKSKQENPQKTMKYEDYKIATNHRFPISNNNNFCPHQQIGKNSSQSLNKINCSCRKQKTNYHIYKPQINRNTAKSSCKYPKCSYKCSKSERNKRKVNDTENVVLENQSEQDEEVNVLLKARRLRNSSVGPSILGQDAGTQKKSKVCICSLKLLQTLREEQDLRQVEEEKHKNYNKYFQNFQQKQEKRKACKCKKRKIHLERDEQSSVTIEKPAQLQQCLQAFVETCGKKQQQQEAQRQKEQQQLFQQEPVQEHQEMEQYSNSSFCNNNFRDQSEHSLKDEAACICSDNDSQNIQQELKFQNPLEPSESYLEILYNNSQMQQKEYYNYLQRGEENMNFENLGTLSPQQECYCFEAEDSKEGNDSHNMQPHQQYAMQCPNLVCSDDNDRMRYIDNGEFTNQRQQRNSFQEEQPDNQICSASCEGRVKQNKPRMVSNQAYIHHEDNEIFTPYYPEEVPSENVKLNSYVSDFDDNCMKYYSQTPNEEQLHIPLNCTYCGNDSQQQSYLSEKTVYFPIDTSSQYQYPLLNYNVKNQKECNLQPTYSDVQELHRNFQESDRIRYIDCDEEDSFQEHQSDDQTYSCSAPCMGVLIQPPPSMVSNQSYIQNVDNDIFTQQSHEVPQKLQGNSLCQIQPESDPLNYYVSEFDDGCLCSVSRSSVTDFHRLSTISKKTLYFPNDTSSQCQYPQLDHEVHEQEDCYLQSTFCDVNCSQNMQQQQQEQEMNGSFQELDRMICIESDALPIQLQEKDRFEEHLSDIKLSSASCECLSSQAYIQQADNEIFTEYSPKDLPQMLQLNSPSQIQPVNGQYNSYASDFDYVCRCSECNSQKSLQLAKNEQEQYLPYDLEKTLFYPTYIFPQCQCRQQDHNVPTLQPSYSDANYSIYIQQQQKGQELNRKSQEADIIRYIDCDVLPVQQQDEDQNQIFSCSGSCEDVLRKSISNQASQPENVKLNCYDNSLHYYEEQQPEQEIKSGYSLKSFENLTQCVRMTRDSCGNIQDQQLESLCECELTTSLEEMNSNESKPLLQRDTNDRFHATLRPYVTQSTWNIADPTDSKQIPGPLQEAQKQLIQRKKGSLKEKKPMIHSGFYWRLIKKYDIQPIPDVNCNVASSKKKKSQ